MTSIRHRKALNGDVSQLLPTHIDNGNQSSTAPRRSRRHSKRNPRWGSFVASIGCFTFLASLCIVGFCRLQNSQKNNKHVPRFLTTKFRASAATADNASSDITYDIAILGAGPAGLSAAIFGARAGLTVLVMGSHSGLLAETPRLENFPGYYGASSYDSMVGTGEDWLATTRSQARNLGAHFALPGLMASSLEHNQNDSFSMKTQLDTFHSKSVIVATGATSRRLNLANEDDLWGNHLHNCAICDGHMYKDKTVVVIGGGDAAIDAAIYLSRQAERVYLVHRRRSFDKVKAQSSLQLIRRTSNIEILTPYAVSEWDTSEYDRSQLTGSVIENTETKEQRKP